MPPTSRATVVLPVPGFPTKTRCRVIAGVLSPASLRLASILSRATCRWISALTARRPMRPSRSASNSSRLFGSGSGLVGSSGLASGSGATATGSRCSSAVFGLPLAPWAGSIGKRPGAMGSPSPRSKPGTGGVWEPGGETSRKRELTDLSSPMTSVHRPRTVSVMASSMAVVGAGPVGPVAGVSHGPSGFGAAAGAGPEPGCGPAGLGTSGESEPSWAAAAVVALPIVRLVGRPREAPARQTSPRAFAYAVAWVEPSRISWWRVAVGPDRHRRPREAATMKSSAERVDPLVPSAPAAADVSRPQSTQAPTAASATVAARASPSRRAASAGTPAARAAASSEANASDSFGVALMPPPRLRPRVGWGWGGLEPTPTHPTRDIITNPNCCRMRALDRWPPSAPPPDPV